MTRKQLPSRAQVRAHANGDKPIAIGDHHTLYYQCVKSKVEYYSSVDEIVQWIATGPVLQPPAPNPRPSLHTTTPSYEQDQDNSTSINDPVLGQTRAPQEPSIFPGRLHKDTTPELHPVVPHHQAQPIATPQSQTIEEPGLLAPPTPGLRRASTRKRVPRDLLRPTHHGKVYATMQDKLRRKQRVPATLVYPEKQRVTQLEHRCGLYSMALNPDAVAYRQIFHRYQTNV